MAELKQSSRQLLTLGVPLAIGFVAQTVIAFVDAVLVARLGATALAGVTLALAVFSVVMLLGLGVVTAAAPKIADSTRLENMANARAWYVQGSWLAIVIGVIGMVVLLCTRPILLLLGQSPELAEVAQEYNTGAALGLPFFLLYVNARGTMSAIGRPGTLTSIMLAAIVANVAIGWVAIFGAGPLPGFGVRGAGWSSTVVRLLILIAALLVLQRGRGFKSLALHAGPLRPRLPMLLQLARFGSPIGARIMMAEGFLPVLAFFVTGFGADATVAHAVGLRLVSLIGVIALGFSSAATIMAAWARADGDWRALRDLRTSLILVGGAYGLVLSAVTAAAFEFIVRDVFALRDAEIINTLQALLPLLIAYFVLDALGSIFSGYFVGMLDTLVPTAAVILSYWAAGLGGGLLLSGPAGLGLVGLWAGLVFGAALVMVFNLFRSSVHIRALAASNRPR